MHCQKCRTQIKLDHSLVDLNPASFRILIGELSLGSGSLFTLVPVELFADPFHNKESARVAQPRAPSPPRSTASAERKARYDRAVKASPDHDTGKDSAIVSPDSPLAARRFSVASQNPAMSFVMLSQSQIGAPVVDDSKVLPIRSSVQSTKMEETPSKSTQKTETSPEQLSHQVEKSQRLFDILSARSDIDHPVCSHCTELLTEGLQQKQTAVNRERDAYAEFLRKAQHNIPSESEQVRVREELKAAQHKETTALAELEALEVERAALEDEIAALDQESLDLEQEQDTFWRERNAYEERIAEQRDGRDSLRRQVLNEGQLLEALQRTNVYNDSFCIGHDGHFGTINGLRLGRLPDHPVEWPEINAAWGQAVLLLVVVAEKLDFSFSGYRLLPIGSLSKIERIEYPATSSSSATTTATARSGITSSASTVKPKVTQYELFSNGDLPLGLSFLHRGFDNAMVCFLDCLRQLGDHVARPATGQGVKMPYDIHKDKIGDQKRMTSIKLGAFNQEEDWTKACKSTLTCCKFLLAHASRVDDVSEAKPKR